MAEWRLSLERKTCSLFGAHIEAPIFDHQSSIINLRFVDPGTQRMHAIDATKTWNSRAEKAALHRVVGGARYLAAQN
jgi:hypothetical protein